MALVDVTGFAIVEGVFGLTKFVVVVLAAIVTMEDIEVVNEDDVGVLEVVVVVDPVGDIGD